MGQRLGSCPLAWRDRGDHARQRLGQAAQWRSRQRAEEVCPQSGDRIFTQVLTDVNDPLFHLAGGGDEHQQDLARRQEDKFDVADSGPAQVRVLHHGHLVGQLGKQPDRPVQGIIEVVRALQERLDGLLLRRGERFDGRDLVHKQPVAFVSGDPARASREWT